MSIQISWNIDIRRELAKNPFGKIARYSDKTDGLRNLICSFLPSYYSVDIDDAKETAEKISAIKDIDVECVRLIIVHEWNGDITSHFAGYGWTIENDDGDFLLGTEDFTWEELSCI